MQATEEKILHSVGTYCWRRIKTTARVRPYNRIVDSFTQIVIVKDNIIPWRDENGILYVGIEKFLFDPIAVS